MSLTSTQAFEAIDSYEKSTLSTAPTPALDANFQCL